MCRWPRSRWPRELASIFLGRFHMAVTRALLGLAQVLTMANIFICVRYLFFWHARQHTSKQAGLLVELPHSGARRLLVTARRNSELLESCGTISTERSAAFAAERNFLSRGPLSHFQIFSEGLFGLHMGVGFGVCAPYLHRSCLQIRSHPSLRETFRDWSTFAYHTS